MVRLDVTVLQTDLGQWEKEHSTLSLHVQTPLLLVKTPEPNMLKPKGGSSSLTPTAHKSLKTALLQHPGLTHSYRWPLQHSALVLRFSVGRSFAMASPVQCQGHLTTLKREFPRLQLRLPTSELTARTLSHTIPKGSRA